MSHFTFPTMSSITSSQPPAKAAPLPRSMPLRVAMCVLLVHLGIGSWQPSLLSAAPLEVGVEKQAPVVRVNATNQPWDFFHPWSKRAPFSRRALGVVLANNRVLVTAETVANVNYLELEKAESGEKIPAEIEVVDYEADLALLKPEDEKFLAGIKPMTLKDAIVGDHVSLWQLEPTGTLLITGGLVTAVEVSRYPIDDTALLVYRLTSSLQYRESSFTVPVVKDNKLVGLMMRYDARSQNVDVLPAPVIEHFLKEAALKNYRGFPRVGMLYTALRDPQLRRYVGLNGSASSGVYVTEIQKNSPAEAAGLRVGDVILTIGENVIDQDGNYQDKQYGKLSLSHLISTKHYDGDPVRLKIFRDGAPMQVDLKLSHRPAEDYIIEPYVIDKAPRYHVVGGLVLQELSRQYLKEWGDWKKAPERFVYYDRNQDELFRKDDRNRIVILSQVMPTENTVGYESLNALMVTKINDVPLKSLDDVETALQHPVNGFHKIEFEENPRVIYLDAQKVANEEPALMKSYGLPAIKR